MWLPFELICAVYLDYIVTIHFVRPYPNLLSLYVQYVQYTKTLAVEKWLPFELTYAVDLEYIVTIHFFRPYPNLLTLYFHYTKTLAVKKWVSFELICAVYLEDIGDTLWPQRILFAPWGSRHLKTPQNRGRSTD